MNNVYILHHNDLDGRCAASIVINNACDDNKHNVKCVEMSYAENEVRDFYNSIDKSNNNTHIYILDYSLYGDSIKYLIKMIDDGYSVIWNDHHPNSLNDCVKELISKYVINPYEYLDKIDGIRTTDYCGAVCTYKYIFGETAHLPLYLQYVNSWDIFEPGLTKFIFNYGIGTYPTNAESKFWTKLNDNPDKYMNTIMTRGEGIYQYLLSHSKKVYRASAKISIIINNHKYKCLLANDPLLSLVINNAYLTYDALIMWFYDELNGVYKYSVRSRVSSKFNCDEFARKYNGGGHFHAAGFLSKQLYNKF